MSVIVGFGASWFGSDYDLQLSGAQRNHTPHHIYYLMVEVRIGASGFFCKRKFSCKKTFFGFGWFWCKWLLVTEDSGGSM